MAGTKKYRPRHRPNSKQPFRIAEGRPPMARKPQATLSKEAAQEVIRTHHNINKQLAKAEAKGNKEEADQLRKRIEDLGGLKSYQDASIQGQSDERGGDSSKLLVQWLHDVNSDLSSAKPKLRMLEVGALSTQNACSRFGKFDIERIDLNSQAEGIVKQDFMQRPIPKYDKDQFDIISLSLVLNFVPTDVARGEMLKRTCHFLDKRAPRGMSESLQRTFPALFLVLPTACITNSRYMNEERLTLMMASLGYVLLKVKQTDKLVYYLWQLRDPPSPDQQNFPKKEIRSSGGRNNFSIVLQK